MLFVSAWACQCDTQHTVDDGKGSCWDAESYQRDAVSDRICFLFCMDECICSACRRLAVYSIESFPQFGGAAVCGKHAAEGTWLFSSSKWFYAIFAGTCNIWNHGDFV